MKAKINNKSNWLFLNGKSYKTNEFIDIPFSEAMRLMRTPNVKMDIEAAQESYDPLLFNELNKFAFLADTDSVSGWGNVGTNLVKYSSMFYDIALIGKTFNVTERSVIDASRKHIDEHMGLVIHEQPKSEWEMLPFGRKIAIVPFETTRVPASWVPRINKCHALLVPCKQNMDAFRDSGVTVPIEVIHWGVDPGIFYPVSREEGRPFTFGTLGHLSTRKGTDVLIKAFLRAFPNEQDVSLICKTSDYRFMFGTKDKRVKVEMTPVPHDEVVRGFFKKVDCFVFPTRGEGFGLTPLEAMATGMPAIVTNWSGPAEYMNEEIGWLLDYTMVPADVFSKNVYREDCGNWAEPSEDHLVHLMRYAYEHQDEVKSKGEKAAEYVKSKWLWENQIGLFHEALKKYL